MKRVTMELGGHGPVMVFDDADIDPAVEVMSSFKFRNAGQVCVAPTRFYIHEKVYDEFLTKFMDKASKVKVGDGFDPESSMGPLAHARRIDAMNNFVNDAKARGATIETGGEQIGDVGNYYAPTIVTNIPDDSLVMTEEPFGPIAPMTTFTELDDVIARANSTPFGLASFAFTQNTKTALAIQNEIVSGAVNINHVGHALPETPFGGVKDSGIGSEGGLETFEAYLNTKFVTQLN